jgi:Arc/MetJ-type ribon-helix-helix transcriptional regulator
MSFVANVGSSGTPTSLASLEGTPNSTQLQNLLKGMSLTILGSTGEIEGPGDVRVRLETPTTGPEDIPLNEFLQQLDAVENMPVEPFVYRDAVNELVDASATFAQGIHGNPPMDAATAAQIAESFEGQALVVERSIRDLIENSTYPNFSDFLKELVRVSQQLREMATTAKMAAIRSNYELLKGAADQMVLAAEKAKESREKEIAAEKKQAIGQIVGGVASVLFAWMPALGTGLSNIITGSFNTSATGLKTESSAAQFESDLANVAKQRLEAAAKLIDQRTAIADDLRDIAKSLRDAILRLYQDLISSHTQVVRSANV